MFTMHFEFSFRSWYTDRMRKTLSIVAITCLLCTEASAQAPLRIRTTPKLPPRDSLERMNLTLAWKSRVTIDGSRDGIASVQVLPGRPSHVLVQTLKGAVYLYDGDNGDLIGKTTVGAPYWASQPAGFNGDSIFLTRRSMLHVLNRATGAQRTFADD